MKSSTINNAACVILGAGFLSAVFLQAARTSPDWSVTAPVHAGESRDDEADAASVLSELERLKERATDQAHVMVSVSYHFNNLWFAGQHENWPLAQFYLNETRSHLRWAVRVIPVRKDSRQRDVDLRAILQAVENSPLKTLEEAIQSGDRERFVDAYRFTLDSCYACHKASDKPYLRLQIPERPADPMLNFDRAADEEPSRFQLPEKSPQTKP